MLSENSTAETSPTTRKNWKGFLLILCVAIFAVVVWLANREGTEYGTDVAYYAGYYLAYAILISYVFYVAVGKGGPSVLGGTFVAVWATFILASVVNIEYQKRETSSQLGHIVEQVNEFADELWKESSDGTLSPIETTFSPSKDAQGSMFEMQSFISEIMNDVVAIQNEYSESLNVAGIATFLDAERLANDSEFDDSREMLAKFDQAFTSQESRFKQFLIEAPNRINSLDVSESEKTEMHDGFLKGLGKSKALRDRNMYLERASLRELGEVVDFLEKNRDSWYVDDGQFLFETDDQVNTYNQHLANLDMYVAEQEKNQREAIENAKEKFRDLGY